MNAGGPLPDPAAERSLEEAERWALARTGSLPAAGEGF